MRRHQGDALREDMWGRSIWKCTAGDMLLGGGTPCKRVTPLIDSSPQMAHAGTVTPELLQPVEDPCWSVYTDKHRRVENTQ